MAKARSRAKSVAHPKVRGCHTPPAKLPGNFFVREAARAGQASTYRVFSRLLRSLADWRHDTLISMFTGVRLQSVLRRRQ